MDQIIGTYIVLKHQKMAYGYILHNFEYCRNKCSDCSHAEQQCENKGTKYRMFIRNLLTQLVSEQIKRHSEISTGVHKPVHLKLHQF